MMQIFIMFSIITSSMIFMQMNHPLAMGIMLLTQTLLMCMASGMVAKTFWFSYILFLVFLGGMLVLFIYVTSLASNEMFSMSTKIMSFIIMMVMITTLFMMIIDPNMILPLVQNNEMESITESLSTTKENTMLLNKIYNYPTNFMTILLVIYLLITLIAIVKITNIFYGPLRQMN